MVPTPPIRVGGRRPDGSGRAGHDQVPDRRGPASGEGGGSSTQRGAGGADVVEEEHGPVRPGGGDVARGGLAGGAVEARLGRTRSAAQQWSGRGPEAAGDGSPVDEVARRVHLSPGTVRNYLSSAASKLGSANRHEAVVVARRMGWI